MRELTEFLVKRCEQLRVDLAFGSNSQLRALAEVYASDDAKENFQMILFQLGIRL